MSTQSTNIDVRIARARAAAAKEMNEALREAFVKAMRVAKEAAEASPQLREDADRLREALRVLTWKYARTSRVSGATPEAMLVQLKRVLNAESVAADRRVGA